MERTALAADGKRDRIDVLRQLVEPRSCTEVAKRLDQTQQRVYYHEIPDWRPTWLEIHLAGMPDGFITIG